MITEKIIKSFEQYTGDTTELSSEQELDLANKIYKKILTEKVWTFLLTAGTGTVVNDSIDLPDDFFYIPIISYYTDTGTYASDKVIFIGPQKQPYKIINFTDRLKYINVDGYAYIDLRNNKIVFTKTPPNSDVYYTYIYRPDDLTLDTEPVFPSEYHVAIYHGMISDDMICQLFDKARSYAKENEANYMDWVNRLALYDSQFYAQ